ncbi:RnfH family protein [Burkholderia sp. L27(2015)]|uniref:RnfH family protein n=1 Tax=Burkholderia sp. L27(2015) TaxID=1641858 RepID=UPI00131D7428|nr:RnfH family protein [Burkholderia sp. L27(2015)]
MAQNDAGASDASSPTASSLTVTVCYALPDVQTSIECRLPVGSTAIQAIRASAILERYPELDPLACKIGIFGKVQSPDTVLTQGDRVELYRPLTVDPKVARQRRVEKIRAAGSTEGRKWQSKETR